MLAATLLISAAFASPAQAARCEFSLKNEWNTGFTAEVTITNDGPAALDGWAVGLAFDHGAEITQAWNTRLSGNNPYQAKHRSYNRRIAPGSSRTFGFNGSKNHGLPVSVPTLSGVCDSSDGGTPPPDPDPVPPTSAACAYEVLNGWNSGFTGRVTLTNVEDVAIEGWAVTLDFPDGSQISGSWNSKRSGNGPYRFENANYNGTIEPGNSVNFGFNAQRPTENAPDANPVLGGLCVPGESGNQRPVADASASTTGGEVPLSVDFSALGSTDADGDVLSYAWVFGDGATSAQPAPTHIFDSPGTYEVSLVVSDGQLDSAPVTLSITATAPDPDPDPDPVEGGFVLDAGRSALYFVSTKKTHVLEVHSFTRLSGQIDETGAAEVSIDLDSVDSGIAIRDQRMRDHLFETALYGEAVVSLNVDLGELADIPVGSAIERTISPAVNLHGVMLSVDVQAKITRLSQAEVLVQNTAPILVKAADFDLVDGIEALRDLAGLSVISYTVPTNFHLVFRGE